METQTKELKINKSYHGSVGSPLWIKDKYPRQLNEQVEKYLEQIICNIKSPVIEFNGQLEDNLDFIRAVKLYAEFPEWI